MCKHIFDECKDANKEVRNRVIDELIEKLEEIKEAKVW